MAVPQGDEGAGDEGERPASAPAGASTSAWRKAAALPWIASTYFAEGLPFSIVHKMASEFFTSLGASPSSVGLTSLYGLAWNAKFVWSPLVDLFGTTRRWLVVMEALLGLVVMALAWPAQRGDLGSVARVLVLVAVLAATHDVAIDGFYLRALGPTEQAAYSGVRVAAYRVAMLVGNAALFWLGSISWFWSFFAAGAILMALALWHAQSLPAEVREPNDERPPFSEAFRAFLAQPKIAVSLAFILLYNAGDAMMFAMSAPFLRSLGFAIGGRALINGLNVFAVIAGSTLGGAMIARAGLRRMLFPIACAQSLAIPLYVALAATRPPVIWIGVVAALEQFVAGVGSSAFVVFLMRRCSGKYKASHFAIGSALMSVASTVAGSTSGYLVERLGFTTFFMLAFAASIPGVALTRWVPRD